MAGDWLKMTHALPEKPEVLAIAGRTGLSRFEVVGRLFILWRWFDNNTVDGNALGVTSVTLNECLFGYQSDTNFVSAVVSAHWLTENDDGIGVVKFDEHISESAKTRAQTAKRVAKSKVKTGNAEGNASTVTKTVPREEKRREEINTIPDGMDGKPSKLTDPDEIIFGYGVPMLVNAGTAEKQARSFLGGLRKHHGDETLIDKLRECIKAKPLQPLEWLAAALPPSGAKPKLNKQEALEASNAAVAERFLRNNGYATQ